MAQFNQQRNPSERSALSMEELIEVYYSQFLQWAKIFTREEPGSSQDLVHDFIIHLSVTRPDLRNVNNLQGYLYKSLRHIYLSGLSRASREAAQFTDITSFDYVQFALEPRHQTDPLKQQNDLRSLCQYSIWRKNQTKMGSYFILHFFHGYHYQEVAQLGRVPITTVYNKLRTFRLELRARLDAPEKLLFTKPGTPPTPAPQQHLLSSSDLLKELRLRILESRVDRCLPEAELLAQYTANEGPLDATLLAHIASCEQCLTIIDISQHRPSLGDRDPFESLSSKPRGSRKPIQFQRSQRLQQTLTCRLANVFEHRPSSLAIAKDGKILACHSVQGPTSSFSVRLERYQQTEFVEVFSDQHVRLAMLPTDEEPPHGENIRSEHVRLSDDRWLTLCVRFDGLGLICEVVYYDPCLAFEYAEAEDEASAHARTATTHREMHLAESAFSWVQGLLTPRSGLFAFACATVVVAALGIGVFLRKPGQKLTPDTATAAIERAVQTESAASSGKTTHQIFNLEVSVNDTELARGTVEIWKDADGRRVARRLFDSKHHLLAAALHEDGGMDSTYLDSGYIRQNAQEKSLLAGDVWKDDVTAQAFQSLLKTCATTSVSKVEKNLVVSASSSRETRLISADLILDGQFHPTQERITLRDQDNIRSVHFIEAGFERKNPASVPDKMFSSPAGLSRAIAPPSLSTPKTVAMNRLVDLRIAVLYQLDQLNVGTTDLVNVEEPKDGRIRVLGYVSDVSLADALIEKLKKLSDADHLDLQIRSTSEVAGPHRNGLAQRVPVQAYDLTDAKLAARGLLEDHFQSKGLRGAGLDRAIEDYSHVVLARGQATLQQAAALDRLCTSFSKQDLQFADVSAQQQWLAMASKHAANLDADLDALESRLILLHPNDGSLIAPATPLQPIENFAQFRSQAHQALTEAQRLNQSLSDLFAAGDSQDPSLSNTDAALRQTAVTKSLLSSIEMVRSTRQLSRSFTSASITKSSHNDSATNRIRP